MQIQSAVTANLPTSDYSSAIAVQGNNIGGDDSAAEPEQILGDDVISETGRGETGQEQNVANEEVSEEGPRELTEEEEQEVRELEQIDRQVREHEQAHVAAGGRHVRGGPTYEYVEGPDGQRYAVAGSVSLDTSEEGDPEETVQKMREVRQAALAPADPSPADHRIAQQANQTKMQARMEKQQEEQEEEAEGAGGPQTIEDFASQRGGLEDGGEDPEEVSEGTTGVENSGINLSQIFNPDSINQSPEAAMNLLV